jgi:uncharacterized protein
MATLRRFFTAPASHFFLFGPRGTGKTSWLRENFADALRIDLLDPETHRTFAARPELLRQRIGGQPGTNTVVLDEVQRVPELLNVVHQVIEGSATSPRFVLTGSSARKLRQAGVNLLGGRAARRALHPFLAAEVGPSFRLEDALVDGLLPLVWSAPDRQEALQAYVLLYLREEVQAEGLVRRLDAFARFLEAIAFSHAQALNLAEVARESQVSRKTAEGYLEILEDLLLAIRLPVFSRRAKRRVAQHPKLYLFDAGVFGALRRRGPLDRPEEIAGEALEGFVAQHLRAWLDYSQARMELFYWRTREGNEVDFVLYGEDGFAALEVKNSATVRPKDLRSLVAFGEDYPEAKRILLYRGEHALQREDGIVCLPCGEFLLRLTPGDFSWLKKTAAS